jgi:hypothetical protein
MGRRITHKDATIPAFNNLFANYRCRSARIGVEFAISRRYFKHLTKSNCFYCGSPPSNLRYYRRVHTIRNYKPYLFNGVDRVDNTKGYSESNAVACCKKCNQMKNKYTMTEYIEHCRKVLEWHENNHK